MVAVDSSDAIREPSDYHSMKHVDEDHVELAAGTGFQVTTSENIHEALFLFTVASLGFIFNMLVIVCILTSKSLRRMTSAFVVHGCVLDVVKCLYCVPFATSLLLDVAPGFCAALGGSYVVIVTASGFNIVAMICCEAYAFSEYNVGADGRGSFCCAVFGIVMVYVSSVIIHLGPTIIGGDFNYNDMIGNCIFVYGTIKSYVVHVMWIVIMTLSMIGAIYYLVYFYRHIKANTTHRLASLVRASIAISRGNVANNQQAIRSIVQRTLSRSRVLIMITGLFILCWYPLYLLTLFDPKFHQPTKVYKLLTFIAWSNSAMNPIILILFDQNIDAFRRICSLFLPGDDISDAGRCCSSLRFKSIHRSDAAAAACDVAEAEQRTEVGCGSEFEVPSLPTTLGNGSRGNTLSRPQEPTPATTATKIIHSFPESVYLQRVGCRLCREGQYPSHLQCNGGFGECSGLPRDLSMCELNTLSL